jgi:hypothetical protein
LRGEQPQVRELVEHLFRRQAGQMLATQKPDLKILPVAIITSLFTDPIPKSR